MLGVCAICLFLPTTLKAFSVKGFDWLDFAAGLNLFARPTDFHRSEKKCGLPDPFSCTIQGAKNKRKEKATL